MSDRSRLAIVSASLVAALLAAPLAALAAPAGAMPCCARERDAATPCASADAPAKESHESAGPAQPCPSMVPMACCEAQPAAPITPASAPNANPLQSVAILASEPCAGSGRVRPAAAASAELVARASPLRLSVVLRL